MQLHFYFWHQLGAEYNVAKMCLKYCVRGGCLPVDSKLLKAELIASSLAEEYSDDRY